MDSIQLVVNGQTVYSSGSNTGGPGGTPGGSSGGGTGPGTGGGPGGSGGSSIPAGSDWTAKLRAGNGQDKRVVELNEGWNVTEFTLPSGGYTNPWGGKLNVEPDNQTPAQQLDVVVEVDGNQAFTQQVNSASIDIGVPGHGDGSPVMGRPGSRIKFAYRPVEFQRSADGIARALVEVKVPALGSAFTW